MFIKYIPLVLGLSIGLATQAMEPVAGYKEKMAALKEARMHALETEDWAQFKSLHTQARNEKMDHSLQKAQATAIDIQFAKAVEANDAAAVKDLIAQGANVNIKWLGKPALIHALSNETVNINVIESLLSSDHIDINAKDKEENTALMIIQNRRQSEVSNTCMPTLPTPLLESAKLLIEKKILILV